MDVGRGVMAVCNDLEPGREAEFEAWYERQHVPERLRVPGFRDARRYASSEQASPRYCAFYRLDSVDVLRSAAYLERLAHPTRWTRRTMPWFRAMGRSPCVVTLDRGAGVGGAMSWLASDAGQAGLPVPRGAIAQAFERCARDAASVRLQLWERDPATAGLVNPEQSLRAAPDAVADWIVCIEATSEVGARGHAQTIVDLLLAHDAGTSVVRAPTYSLLSSLAARHAPTPWSDEDAGIIENPASG